MQESGTLVTGTLYWQTFVLSSNGAEGFFVFRLSATVRATMGVGSVEYMAPLDVLDEQCLIMLDMSTEVYSTSVPTDGRTLPSAVTAELYSVASLSEMGTSGVGV